MKILPIVCFFFIAFPALARRANFIEAHELRLSSQTNPAQWVLPFRQQRHPTPFESNLMFSAQKDTLDLYEDMQSKKQDKIQKRLEDSFGRPYTVQAKVNVGFRQGKFSQFFGTNGGAVLRVTDPVFPEMKGFLFHDYVGTSGYLFKPHQRISLKTQLTYGARKILSKQYTVGDLVDKSLSVKFDKEPYVGFVDLNFQGIYSFMDWGSVLFQGNSLPIVQRDYQYWETFLGYKTPDFIPHREYGLSLYGGYSPIYGGYYDVSRTYKVGVNAMWNDFIEWDVFTMDDFYLSSILSVYFKSLSLEFFTFERAYDDFGRQKARDYGVNLKATW